MCTNTKTLNFMIAEILFLASIDTRPCLTLGFLEYKMLIVCVKEERT